MRAMRYGSVCSGIEAATVAWTPLGWEASFYSEIDPFARKVLKHHYPETPLHGDFTTIKADDYEPIDLLVGGTPCQSFSVAGLRGGLADDRGNLALEYLRLADRLRPRWLVWENVPGVLSSNGGRDFGTILGGMVELGYGFAYRVLDAQFFGVAQRRRRVFVVGHARDWRRAAAVLFERESLSGNPPPRREAGQRIAPTIAGSSNGGGANGPGRDADSADSLIYAPLISTALKSRDQKGPSSDGDGSIVGALAADAGVQQQNYVAFNLRGREGGAMPEAADVASLRAASGGSSRSYVSTTAVRRLTPRECERLQGFPDDWTLISVGKGLAKDGPRYKALGNSMAIPVVRWIGERIQQVEKIA